MLVVTSNWAISDGTLVPAAAPWHGRLASAIHRAACRAGLRRDGSYEPIERLDLVLAGDTFDWIASAEWQQGVKPWHGTPAARAAAARIAQRSIRLARRSLGPLIRWARHGVRVPGSRGRSAGSLMSVPTRVTFLAGDRDATIEQVLGTGHARHPLTVGWQWDDGRVSIRHGHDLDPACGGAVRERRRDDRQPTLAESVGVDLVGPFAAAVGRDSPDVRRLARRLTGATPVEIPAVIAGWTAGPTGHDAASATLAGVWRRCVDAWWHEARRSVPTCEVEFDVVDALAAAFAAAFTAGPGRWKGLAALRPAVPRGAPGLVLGHLSGSGADASPVCLGGGDADVPGLVACVSGSGWPRWQSLLPPDERAVVVAIRDPSMDVVHGGPVVVDAA